MLRQTRDLRRFKQTANKLDVVGLLRALHLIDENILFLFKQFLKKWTCSEFIKQVSTKLINGYYADYVFFFNSVKIEIKPKDDQNYFIYLEI